VGSHSVICHPTEVTARLHPNRAGWYLIYRPHKDKRLSWPSWLVTDIEIVILKVTLSEPLLFVLYD